MSNVEWAAPRCLMGPGFWDFKDLRAFKDLKDFKVECGIDGEYCGLEWFLGMGEEVIWAFFLKRTLVVQRLSLSLRIFCVYSSIANILGVVIIQVIQFARSGDNPSKGHSIVLSYNIGFLYRTLI